MRRTLPPNIIRLLPLVVVVVAIAIFGTYAILDLAASSTQGTPPSAAQITRFEATPTGRALFKNGYMPTVAAGQNQEGLPGIIYIRCGNRTPKTCAGHYLNLVSNRHPGVVVVSGEVVKLIGSSDSTDDAYFFLNVPKSLQNFGMLVSAKQHELLGALPAAARENEGNNDGSTQVFLPHLLVWTWAYWN